MGWKMVGHPETKLADKKLVEEFFNMEPVPHDRPLSERRLMVYERTLAQGSFRTVVWASVACKETGSNIYRVNGKHTSIILKNWLDSGKDLPKFYVTVERYVADTLHDVANLYNTFDSALASRSNRDVNMAFAATVPQLKDAPVRLIHATVTAAAYLKWGESREGARVSAAEKAEELLDRFEFVNWFTRVCPSTANPKSSTAAVPLLRSPVVTAMMATYDRAPRLAEDFWKKVHLETDQDRDNPTRTLARYLIRVAVKGGTSGGARSDKKVVTWREVFVKCLHAWNAWRKGETTALNYHAKAPVPKVEK